MVGLGDPKGLFQPKGFYDSKGGAQECTTSPSGGVPAILNT